MNSNASRQLDPKVVGTWTQAQSKPLEASWLGVNVFFAIKVL